MGTGTPVLVGVLSLLLALAAIGAALALRSRIGSSPELERLRAATVALTWSDRWKVLQAVQKGRAVAAPHLAPAAVARARYVRVYGRRMVDGPSRFAWPVVALLQFSAAAIRVLDPGTPTALRWLGAGTSLLVGVLLLSVPVQWRFYSRRADRAEQANLELMYEAQR